MKSAHQGAVKGLQVNNLQSSLIASGAMNAEVLLWDLNSMQSYPPTQNKSSRLEDITDVAWNNQVAHILAAASSNGYTVIWDLRQRKEVIQLCLPGGRKTVSSAVWNPDNATHILTATDDDQSPFIYSWDLRNSHAPSMTLSGHSKGVLSMSWCPKDAELLLSSGKDNVVLCWNPQTGEKISEVSRSSNWIFDTQWCPRNPDIFSAASFDGRIAISSFQALSSSVTNNVPPTSFSADPFGRPQAAAVVETGKAVKQIPKWLRRPIGASFGFGGRLVSFSENSPRCIAISTLASKDPLPSIQNALKLDAALRENVLGRFCSTKATHPINNLHETDHEAVFWNVIKALVEPEPQKKLLSLLGFDVTEFALEFKDLRLSNRQPSVEETIAPKETISPIDFGETADGDNIFDQIGSAKQEDNTTNLTPDFKRKSFSLYNPDASEVDRGITKAIVVGDFATAVDLCIKTDRLADALLVSLGGGPELIAKTQSIYVERSKNPYLRVVLAVLQKDLNDTISNASVENWEELLGLICSFATSADFTSLCSILASRLEQASRTNHSLLLPSAIAMMASGDAAGAAQIILHLESNKAPSSYSYSKYASWLEGLVEKLRGIERAASGASGTPCDLSSTVPEVATRFLEYSVLMANQGSLDISARYFVSKTDSELASVFGDRLASAVKGLNVSVPQVVSPFTPVNVVPEAQKIAQQPVSLQAPYQQSSYQQSSGFAPQSAFQSPAAPVNAHVSAFQPAQQPFPPSQPSYQAAQLQPAAPQTFQPTMPQAPQPFQAPSAPVNQFNTWNPPPAAPVTAPSMPINPAPNPFSQPPVQPTAQSQLWNTPLQQTSPTQLSAFPAAPIKPGSFDRSSSFSSSMMPPPSMMNAAPAPPPAASFGTSPMSPSSIAPSAPFIPAPHPVMTPPLAPTPSLEAIRKPVGGFNDAPMIPPKQPFAPAHTAPVPAPTFTPAAPMAPSAAPHLGGPPLNMINAATAPMPTPTMAPPPTSGPVSPRFSQAEPVDPSKIPANSQAIYQAFSTLISFCQQRALPQQRRILEDSIKRLQHLFHQLANQELSPHVHSEMLRMSQLIAQRHYDGVLELQVPLMTAHFTEVGQWILAVKRLIEVAKSCPPQ